ncbi:MAG: putative endoprotease [Gemmatimonadales bacterium]|nr:putative endoprotease [Gemmatimonadales bacterium]
MIDGTEGAAGAGTTTTLTEAQQAEADKAKNSSLTPTAEQKAAEEKAAADKVIADKAAADKAAAEKAEVMKTKTYTLKLPEKSALDASVTERTTAIARTLGLSTDDAAQKVLDFAHQETATAMAAAQESLQPGGAVWDQQVTTWKAQSLADPELGNGKQETLDAVATKAKAVIERYASPAVKELLHKSGLGAHPEVVRMFYKIAKAAGEGSLVTGTPPGGGKKSAAEILYGDSPTTTGVTQ